MLLYFETQTTTSTSTSRYGLRNRVMTQTTTDRKGQTEVKIIDTPYRTRVNQRDKNGSPEMNTVASITSQCFFLSCDLKRERRILNYLETIISDLIERLQSLNPPLGSVLAFLDF